MMIQFLVLIGLIHANAEYRAFELKITNSGTGKIFTVKSTLDQNQYADYHPQPPNTVIEYVSSWMCVGRTDGFQPICANPNEAQMPAQSPGAGQQDPALQSSPQ